MESFLGWSRRLWQRIYYPGVEVLCLFSFWWIFVHLAEAVWQFNYPPWARFSLILERRNLCSLLLLGTLFTTWIPLRFKNIYYVSWGAVAWVFHGFMFRQFQWRWDVILLPVLFLVFFAIARVFAHRIEFDEESSKGSSPKTILFGMAGVFGFLVVAYGFGFSYKGHNSPQMLRLFWLIHPEALILLFLQILLMLKTVGSSLRSSLISSYITNPINYFAPQPWVFNRQPASLSERKSLWGEGFALIVWGQLVILISMRLVQFLHLSGAPATYWLPLRQYLPFLLMVIGTMNFIEGLCKMFQIPIKPITQNLWLSPLPSEVWYRGNSHLYQWVYQWIYIPLFRRVKKNALALFLTLIFIVFNSVLLHDLIDFTLYSYLLKIQSGVPQWSFVLFWSLLAWILIWMFLFWVSQRLRTVVYRHFGLKLVGALLTHLIVAYSFAFCFQWLPKMILRTKIQSMGPQSEGLQKPQIFPQIPPGMPTAQPQPIGPPPSK